MTEAYAAIIGVVITSIISIIINYVGLNSSKHSLYVNSITAERIAWINEMRKLCSDLCAICESNDSLDDDPELKREFYQIKNAILVRINPCGSVYENDNKLRSILEQDDFDSIMRDVSLVRDLIAVICKDEWDKIKAESGRDKAIVKKTIKNQEDVRKEMSRKK